MIILKLVYPSGLIYYFFGGKMNQLDGKKNYYEIRLGDELGFYLGI